jgi:hypothetical protein
MRFCCEQKFCLEPVTCFVDPRLEKGKQKKLIGEGKAALPTVMTGVDI